MIDPKLLRYDRVHGLVANEKDVVNNIRLVDTTGRNHYMRDGDEIRAKSIVDEQADRDNIRVTNNAQEKTLVVEFPDPMRRSSQRENGPRFEVHITRMEFEYTPDSLPPRFQEIVPRRTTRSGRDFA